MLAHYPVQVGPGEGGGDQRMRRWGSIGDVIFFCVFLFFQRAGSFFAGLPLPFGTAFAVIPIDMLVRYWS
jgi:hypothetical protein